MSYDIIKFADGILPQELAERELQVKGLREKFSFFYVERDGQLVESLDPDGMIRATDCNFTGEIYFGLVRYKASFEDGILQSVFESKYPNWVQIYPRLEEEQA